MRKKIKVLFLLLIVLALALSIYVLKEKSNPNKKVDLISFKTSDIAKISISTSDDSLFLVKDTNTSIWEFEHPSKKKISIQKLIGLYQKNCAR